MPTERLQKILARAGVASRRKAEELIREGRVTVDGRVATLGEGADPESQSVKVDGRRIRPRQGRRYLLLNKPRGCLCTRADPQGRPTVYDLLPAARRRGLISVGRLDWDSEGLLILTDDGELAQRVAHPRYGCIKTYAVKVKGLPDEVTVDRLRRGVVLAGRRTAPARIRLRRPPRPGTREANSWWTVELGEGRSRQIRDMFQRIGHPVLRLRREAIGGLADPGLPAGAWRELTAAEIEWLRRPRPPRPRKPGRRRGRAARGDG